MIPIRNQASVWMFPIALIFLYGCDTVELQSQWATEPVVIDGNAGEWPEKSHYLEEKSKVLVTVLNDEKNLYIRLLTRNEATQKMFLRAGLTTWIDYSGGNGKKFGVKFPLARHKNDQVSRSPDHKPRNSMQDIEESQYRLAIVHQENHSGRTMSRAEAAERGVLTSLEVQKGYLIYELQVPYDGTGESKIIGLGFETGTMERPSAKGRSGGGRGGGGGMGGKGGSPGGKPFGGGRPESFEMWAQVTLVDMPESQGVVQ